MKLLDKLRKWNLQRELNAPVNKRLKKIRKRRSKAESERWKLFNKRKALQAKINKLLAVEDKCKKDIRELEKYLHE